MTSPCGARALLQDPGCKVCFASTWSNVDAAVCFIASWLVFKPTRLVFWCSDRGAKPFDPLALLPEYKSYQASVAYIVSDLSLRIYLEVQHPNLPRGTAPAPEACVCKKAPPSQPGLRLASLRRSERRRMRHGTASSIRPRTLTP